VKRLARVKCCLDSVQVDSRRSGCRQGSKRLPEYPVIDEAFKAVNHRDSIASPVPRAFPAVAEVATRDDETGIAFRLHDQPLVSRT
jgi:hypothetical protein